MFSVVRTCRTSIFPNSRVLTLHDPSIHIPSCFEWFVEVRQVRTTLNTHVVTLLSQFSLVLSGSVSPGAGVGQSQGRYGARMHLCIYMLHREDYNSLSQFKIWTKPISDGPFS